MRVMKVLISSKEGGRLAPARCRYSEVDSDE